MMVRTEEEEIKTRNSNYTKHPTRTVFPKYLGEIAERHTSCYLHNCHGRVEFVAPEKSETNKKKQEKVITRNK